ncbi:hypothetical protein NM208_g10390 [Fusarium decemcellulare]|uniref:Uncharacterized protein n=1 Tax=Fusarium decemcellulare TaxID=57161 RepID=A0ACC1RY79_9HYPO|nr:hypothetical protein NM208_g10390 [Fusarium decemcellulare]
MLSLYDSMPRGVSKFGSLIWRLALPPKPLAMYEVWTSRSSPSFVLHHANRTMTCRTDSTSRHCVAVLYQDLGPPMIDGIHKPEKLGGALTQFPSSPLLFTDITLRSRLGYLDSGTNIAYTLSQSPDFKVAYPNNDREPKNKLHILSRYPRASLSIGGLHRTVCQVPLIIETYEDKKFVNDLLRNIGGFTMPHSWTVMRAQTFSETFRNLIFPSLSQRSLFEVVAAWRAPAENNEPTCKQGAEECERAVRELGVTEPIRIDVRRFKDSADCEFALFDEHETGLSNLEWVEVIGSPLVRLQNMTGGIWSTWPPRSPA